MSPKKHRTEDFQFESYQISVLHRSSLVSLTSAGLISLVGTFVLNAKTS